MRMVKTSTKRAQKNKAPRGTGGAAKAPRARAPRSAAQTNQPFEQDTKRRIGQFRGAGEPPL